MGKFGSGGAEIGRRVVSTRKTWVQTERAAHEAWAGLITKAKGRRSSCIISLPSWGSGTR